MAALREPAVPTEQGGRPRGPDANVDKILEWVARQHFSEDALGYALRRLAEVGSVEQVIAFSVAVTVAQRHRSFEPEL